MNVRTAIGPVAFTCALLVAASLGAQSQSPQVVAPRRPVLVFAQLQNWIQLSKTHRIGEVDDAVRTLARWPYSEIERIDSDLLLLNLLLEDPKAVDPIVRTPGVPARKMALGDLPALFDLSLELFVANGRPMGPADVLKPDSEPRQAIARILMRAAMMHTDLLTAGSRDELNKTLAAAGSAGLATIRVNDADQRRVADLRAYWSVARTAMDQVARTPVGAEVVRDWYATTAAWLLNQRDYANGTSHVEAARGVLPGEARLALYLGAIYENLASPGIQASFQNGQSATMIGSRRDLLRKAEFQQRSALLLEPDVADANLARLRLGHALLQMARPDEALPFLGAAESGIRRTEAKYAAAFFSGLAHAQLGNRAEARAAFERASAIFPDAQSVRLAIAQLAMLGSNRDEALASIQAIKTTDGATDPLWAYDIDLVWNVTGPLALLRANINERLK